MVRRHVCIWVPGGIAMGIMMPLADPTHGNFAIVTHGRQPGKSYPHQSSDDDFIKNELVIPWSVIGSPDFL